MWYQRKMIACLLLICLIINAVYTDKMATVSAKGKAQIRVRLRIGNQTVSKKTVSVKRGKRKKIKVTVSKKKKSKITFRSNRPRIVSVGKAGKLTAKKTGIAKITVTVKIKKKKYKSWVKIKVVSATKKKDERLPTAQPSATPTPTSVPALSVTPKPSPMPPVEGDGSDMGDSPDIGDASDMYNIEIRINGKAFSAKLYQTETTKLFMQKLPLSITMNELNGNEKYYYFSESFPTESQRVSQIHAGDLKLYGSSCLVLFYKSFSTSYSYTSLGYVENPEGLAEAVGSGNVSAEIVGFDKL